MMRAERSTSLLVAFYLLTSAATAYAECAWVLWGVTPNPSTFLPSNAFKTREDCHSEKARMDMKVIAEMNAGRTPAIVLTSCLPDTVDPRGPKGK